MNKYLKSHITAAAFCAGVLLAVSCSTSREPRTMRLFMQSGRPNIFLPHEESAPSGVLAEQVGFTTSSDTLPGEFEEVSDSQIIFKCIESIVPSFCFRLLLFRVPVNGPHEILNLYRCRCLVFAYKCEVVFVVEKFVYKICLTDTTTAAYNYQFGTVRFQAPL